MTLPDPRLERLAIDTIRTLSIDGVQQANSGHPGAPMGAAAMARPLTFQLAASSAGVSSSRRS